MKKKVWNHTYGSILIFILIFTLVGGGVLQGFSPQAFANASLSTGIQETVDTAKKNFNFTIPP